MDNILIFFNLYIMLLYNYYAFLNSEIFRCLATLRLIDFRNKLKIIIFLKKLFNLIDSTIKLLYHTFCEFNIVKLKV